MNKTEFVMEVAKQMDMSGGKVNELVNTALKVIETTLVNGEIVNLTGFGKFVPMKSQARQGRNPQTGKALTIKAKTTIKFRPSGGLKEKANCK